MEATECKASDASCDDGNLNFLLLVGDEYWCGWAPFERLRKRRVWEGSSTDSGLCRYWTAPKDNADAYNVAKCIGAIREVRLLCAIVRETLLKFYRVTHPLPGETS